MAEIKPIRLKKGCGPFHVFKSAFLWVTYQAYSLLEPGALVSGIVTLSQYPLHLMA